MITTMILIGLAALNTAAPLLYMMFSMMCAFFVLSALLATNTMRGLKASRRAPSVWPAQQPLRVELRVRNGKLLTASYSVRVKDLLKGKVMLGAAFFDRVPGRGAELGQDYECLFLKRGVYRLERLEIATRFPFGLIERSMSWSVPHEILVLPQSIRVDSVMEEARAELGDFESARKGQGSGLYGLRGYTPELPARDIHWKISARRGTLIAREYESEEKRRAIVILDNRMAAGNREAASEAFEKGIVLASSVIEWLSRNEHEVELRTASGIIGFGVGGAHVTRCRRALARLEMIDPEADPVYLRGEDAGVPRFPIVYTGRMAGAPGLFPVAVSQFEQELTLAFTERQPAAIEGPEPGETALTA